MLPLALKGSLAPSGDKKGGDDIPMFLMIMMMTMMMMIMTMTMMKKKKKKMKMKMKMKKKKKKMMMMMMLMVMVMVTVDRLSCRLLCPAWLDPIKTYQDFNKVNSSK